MPEENTLLCKVKLTQKDVDTLKEAIEDLYYFEFILGRCNKDNLTRTCKYIHSEYILNKLMSSDIQHIRGY